MSDLARLKIWDDPAVRGALSWYLDVAENRRPAKFRIAATVNLLNDWRDIHIRRDIHIGFSLRLRWTKMRHARARSSTPGTLCHMLSSADCIIATSESEFSVHTAQFFTTTE